MELRTELTFGLERLITETTFVKDDLLKRQCRQFQNDLENGKVFQMDFARLEDGIEASLDIDRGRIPLGSDIFQAVMAEILRDAEVRRRQLEQQQNKESNDQENTQDLGEFQNSEACERTERQKKQMKKSASFYPVDKENVLLKRFRSEQLFRDLPTDIS